jgi:hypothetical protein
MLLLYPAQPTQLGGGGFHDDDAARSDGPGPPLQMGFEIRVKLNGQEVNVFQSTRQTSGFLALQAYAPASRVQFRNVRIKKLP